METALQYCSRLPWSPYREVIFHVQQDIMHQPNIKHHRAALLAKKYHISESTLKRCFKASMQQSLHAFVTAACMHKAAVLLQTPGLSIKQAAARLGYREKSGFTRAFKRFHGKTPKQFYYLCHVM